MSGKLFDYDPLTKTVQWFHWDEASKGKEMIIQTQQDTTDLIESNKFEYNNHDEGWGEGRLVARIPLSIYAQLNKQGITKDQKAFRRWLNDPDNRCFRLRGGRI